MEARRLGVVILALAFLAAVLCSPATHGEPPAGPPPAPPPSAPAPAPSAPGLVARENPVVFPPAFDDDTVVAKVGLRNTSDRPIAIRDARGSCGCMRVGPFPKGVPPGGEVEIAFSLRLTGVRERFAKAVTITSNDPTNPKLRVRIEGEVRQRLIVETDRVLLRTDADTPIDLVVRSGGDAPLEGLTAVSSVPDLLLSASVDGKVAHVKGVAPRPKGRVQGTITLRLGDYERVIRVTDTDHPDADVPLPRPSRPVRSASTPGGTPPRDLLAVAFTGEDHGQFEPCQCSQGMLGGLSRRTARLGAFVEPGVPFVAVSGGGITLSGSPWDAMRFDAIARALASMGYAALAPSRLDVSAPVAGRTPGPERKWPPLVAMDLAGDVAKVVGVQDLLALDVSGTKLWVTGIAGTEDPDTATSTEIREQRTKLVRAIRGRLPPNSPLVLLANVRESDARELLRHTGAPTLILYAGGVTDPTPEDVKNGGLAIAPFPAEGKFVGLARLSGSAKRLRWFVEYRPVVAELPEDPEIVALRKEHVQAMRIADLVRASAGDARFGPGPTQDPDDGAAVPSASDGRYAGSASCAECHAAETTSWAASRHSRAIDSLRKTGDDADPSCIGCHVTGYGTGRGFLSEKETPHLFQVGCESCHGPRAQHVAARAAGTKDERPRELAAVTCLGCHDTKHDPDFDYAPSWERIVHGVKATK